MADTNQSGADSKQEQKTPLWITALKVGVAGLVGYFGYKYLVKRKIISPVGIFGTSEEAIEQIPETYIDKKLIIEFQTRPNKKMIHEIQIIVPEFRQKKHMDEMSFNDGSKVYATTARVPLEHNYNKKRLISALKELNFVKDAKVERI